MKIFKLKVASDTYQEARRKKQGVKIKKQKSKNKSK